MKKAAAKMKDVAVDDQKKGTFKVFNKYVTKYKRTKNLVKRCVDISEQCDLDIILVIRDRNTQRCREFYTSHELTIPYLASELGSSIGNRKTLIKFERIYAGPPDLANAKSDDVTKLAKDAKITLRLN